MTTEEQIIPEFGYVFDVNLITGGCVYFTTYTEWIDTGKKGRERRNPCSIKTKTMAKALEDLGQYCFYVDSDSAYQHWLSKRGWAIVNKDFCNHKMEKWLKPKYCLKKPSTTYCDVSISSTLSKDRQTTRFRPTVLQRDGKACLQCEKTESDGIKLTMHHIRPFSKGGETSLENLMVLCDKCNQEIDNDFVESLYDLIDTSYGYDIGLLRGKLDNTTWRWLMRVSGNLMHTRCELI